LHTLPLVVDAAYVRAHLDTANVAVVDGRAAVYYQGTESGGAHGQIDRAGHVHGAHSIPYTELVDEQLYLRPRQELQAVFERAGVASGDTVIGYCHIGQQATAMLFAARLLGHPVLLYDASYQDWSRDPANPVDGPE
jgi:thiosulfate/3-mercaptopyruvate sulfurtransferase